MLLRFTTPSVQKIARLNAQQDSVEIVHLLLEVVFGEPMLAHMILNYAFANDMAIPEIMQVVHRNGKGAIHKDPRRRMNDTLLFISAFMDPQNPELRKKLIEKMNAIHGQYRISNELMKYVAGTFVFDAQHLIETVSPGKELFTSHENLALFHFWKSLASEMGIQEIPEAYHDFKEWYFTYRKTHAAPSDGCREVSEVLAREWARRWFPESLKFMGRNLFYSCFDDILLKTSGKTKPHTIYRFILKISISAVVFKSRYLFNRPETYSLRNFFQKDYDTKGLGFLQHGGYVQYPEGDTYSQPELSAKNVCPFSDKK